MTTRPSDATRRGERIWTPALGVAIALAAMFALVFVIVSRASVMHGAAAAAPRGPAFAPIIEVPEGASRNGIDYQRIDARLSQLVARADMVGLGVAIIEDGKLSFVKGYGVTTEGGGEVTPGTVFRWASCSKGVAATLLGTLAEQGKLSLDDPVSRFKTSLRLPHGSEAQTSVADVLSHRTGIVKNAYDDKLEEGIDPHVIRMMLGTLYPLCKPGTCFAYQNVAYDTASEIVQKVTGKSYGAAVASRLFRPLGMTSASTTREGLFASPSWARPHRGRRELPVEQAYYNIPAAGGINSSIFDMGLWMRAQMGLSHAVLDDDVLATIHDPRVRSVSTHAKGEVDQQLKDASYGLGWRAFDYDGHRLVGHRGAVSGYRSLILFDPARKAGIAMLWNSESPTPVGMQLELFDMLYHLPPRDWMKLGGRG